MNIEILKRDVSTDKKGGFFGRVIFFRITYFIFGFLSAQGIMFDRYNPFGVSLAASVPDAYMIPGLIGAVVGYLFLDKLGRSIRYISMILIVAALKWTFSGAKKISNYRTFVPVICFISSFSIGLISDYSGQLSLDYIYMILLESVTISVCTYCLCRTFKISYCTGGTKSPYDIAYALTSIFVVTLSLYGVKIYALSVGRILSITIVLFAAYCFGVRGGSISGALLSAILGFSSFGTFNTSGVYALAGTFAGVFAATGKIGICTAFFLSGLIFMLHSYAAFNTMPTIMYEIVCAIVIFMMVPKEFMYYIRALFRANRGECKEINHKKNNEKKYISQAIKSVSDVTGTVMPLSSAKSQNEIENTCINSVYKICKGCNLKGLCWEKSADITKNFFSTLIMDTLNNGSSDHECIVSKRCKNINLITDNIKSNISKYNSELEAKNRITELRRGVSEKLYFAETLYEYAYEGIKFNNVEDKAKSKMIKSLLAKFGIETVRTECRFSSQGKIFIEIEVMKTDNKELINKKILEKLMQLCAANLDEPITFDIENRTLIRITEKTIFDLKVRVSVHNCNNGEFCGDCHTYFKDGTGRASAMISDGMGTGGRAAADSAITAGIIERLIKLRVEPSSAVKIANLSILGKSSEESLTAVDIMTFDAFSGKADFIKAGAPLTLIYKKGRIDEIDTSSLPIGIFDETNFSVNSVVLDEGDTVLMMSDGVTDSGTDWVKDKLKDLKSIGIENFSENILKGALERRGKNHDDDITVMTIEVTKNR